MFSFYLLILLCRYLGIAAYAYTWFYEIFRVAIISSKDTFFPVNRKPNSCLVKNINAVRE